MFYSLIPGFVAVLMGISVTAAPPQAVPAMPVLSRPAVVVDRAAPIMPAVAPRTAAAPVARQPLIVIEAPRRISLERIRRESARYPDMDTAGRFVELSTECPPLFGSDE